MWIITSFMWVFFLLLPYVFYASKIQHPKLAGGFIVKIILIVMITLPAFIKLIGNRFNKNKLVLKFFIGCIVLRFLSVLAFTFAFTVKDPFFYPIVSYTDSIKDYLVLDDNIVYVSYDELYYVFPEKIPREAQNVIYRYYCDTSSNTMEINAEWGLPEEDYYIEKVRINGSKYGSVYTYGNSFAYRLAVEFDDEKKSIRYVFEQGTVD